MREKESSISLNGHIPVVYTAKNSEGPPREGASGVVTGPVPQETTGVVQQQAHEERDVPDTERENNGSETNRCSYILCVYITLCIF